MDKTQQSKAILKEKHAVDFEQLFRENWENVYQLLFRMVGDRVVAEDLAMEVFLRLYNRPPKRGEGYNVHGWLYRVATNLGYNALRAKKRRTHYERVAGGLDLDVQSPEDPALEMERAENRFLVRQVLAQMNPRAAKLLVLRHSGFSYTEIAATLTISKNSVGTLLARAEREFEKKYRAQKGADPYASDGG